MNPLYPSILQPCTMPDSPIFSSSDTLTYNILINSQQIKGSYFVISIELERAVFRIPTAKIILGTQPVDSENNQHFASESDDFIPGVEIEAKNHKNPWNCSRMYLNDF